MTELGSTSQRWKQSKNKCQQKFKTISFRKISSIIEKINNSQLKNC